MIYFDAAATSPMLPEVRDKMSELMDLSVNGEFGNPSSLHSVGSRAKFELNEAREQVAKLIGASPLELVFTSGGSESNNTIINIFQDQPILVSAIEHPSVLHPSEEYGDPCIKIPVNDKGIVDLNCLKNKLESLIKEGSKKKILISVMLANNEIGTIEPIKEISEVIKEFKKQGNRNIYLHTDATQAVGKISVNVKELGVDYLTFSSHKLGGPVGIGALYIKTGAPFKPLIFGGAQENKRRAGTSNAILASGFGIAAKNATKTPEKFKKRVTPLRNYLAQKILETIPTAKIISPINQKHLNLPNILNVTFPAAEGESTQLYLDLAKIAVSTGSACASGDLEPSHVIMALFHDAQVAHGSVRFSLPITTRKKDIDYLLKKLPGIITKIQDISTLKPKANHE